MGLVVAVLALATLAFGAGSARADSVYLQTGEFGSADLGNVPVAIATEDSSGRVFVVDRPNNRVVVFESGQPGAGVLTSFGTGTLSNPFGVAIDQDSGDVYVGDAGNNRILRYESDGGAPPAYTVDAAYVSPAQGSGAEEVGSFASSLAIDPSNGDLLVADAGNKRVERFDDTGAFVSGFDGSAAPGGAFTSLIDLTVDGDGDVFVVANGTVEPEFEAMSGAVVESFEADGSFLGEFAPGELGDARAVAFDTVADRLLVTSGGGASSPAQTFRAFAGSTQVEAIGIAAGSGAGIPADVSTRGNGKGPISVLEAKSYLGSEGVSGVEVIRLVASPEVTISAPSILTPSSVMLKGTVDPNGEDDTTFHFEYRKKPQSVFEQFAPWQSTPDQDTGSSANPEPVETEAPGLAPNEEYEVRILAGTAGRTATSGELAFHTISAPPLVQTEGATGVTESGATLNGSVNAEGTASAFYFEFGTTAAYGSKVPGSPASAGGSRVLQRFSRPVSGLQAGTTYHFRIVAQNAAGQSVGADQTFVASPALSEGRAYEQVTPIDKEAAIPDVEKTVHVLGDSDRLVYTVRMSPHAADAKANAFDNRYISTRSGGGWSDWINSGPLIGSNNYGLAQHVNIATSEDGEYAFVISDRALAPGAKSGHLETNLYIENIRTNTYEFVGSVDNPIDRQRWGSGGTPDFYKAGSANFSWMVFVSPNPLLPGVNAQALYRWNRGSGLELVSKLPDGSIPSAGVSNYGNASYASRWTSRDGRRIFFELEGVGTYVWEDGQTRALSKSEIDGTVQPANFDDASADGRYAFIGANTPLTADAPSSPSGANLYRVDVVSGDIEVIGPVKNADTIGTRSSIEGTSADGKIVYFLPPAPGFYDAASAIEVWDGEGPPSVVADELGVAGFRFPASLSPSGRYLGFQVQEDIYVYDHASGDVACASCRAGQLTRQAALPAVRLGEEFPTQTVAFDNYQPRAMVEGGQAFFTSLAALVPEDTNGVADVYSWKDGRASLISPGNQPRQAILGEVSPGGRDVYFTTAQGLVAQDVDNEADLYDARIGGGIAAQNQLPAPPCQGESCQSSNPAAAAAPPIGSEGGGGQAAAKPKSKSKRSACAKKKGKKKCPKGRKHAKQGGKRGTGR